jgi:hypothetical protein
LSGASQYSNSYFASADSSLIGLLPPDLADSIAAFQSVYVPDVGTYVPGSVDPAAAQAAFNSLINWINTSNSNVIQFGPGITLNNLTSSELQAMVNIRKTTGADGKGIVSGSHDRTLVLSDLKTGKIIRNFSTPQGSPITSLAISADAADGSAGAPASPPQKAPTGLARDFCAVCNHISLANALVMPVSPAAIPPISFIHELQWSSVAIGFASRDHFYFDARGPPHA